MCELVRLRQRRNVVGKPCRRAKASLFIWVNERRNEEHGQPSARCRSARRLYNPTSWLQLRCREILSIGKRSSNVPTAGRLDVPLGCTARILLLYVLCVFVIFVVILTLSVEPGRLLLGGPSSTPLLLRQQYHHTHISRRRSERSRQISATRKPFRLLLGQCAPF